MAELGPKLATSFAGGNVSELRGNTPETGALPDFASSMAARGGTHPDAGMESTTVAAVDLGSNSFHLIVAQVDQGRVLVIDKIKDMARLAAGLDTENHLSEQAIVRALDVLGRFGQRLRHIPDTNVRVVGTNTLRKARNRDEFIARAQAAVGHDIEIISGREEARLIYLGVSHTLEDNSERRLVVDIGGGSTEMILGRRFLPDVTESLYMGCVAMSQTFFGDGRIRAQAMAEAKLAAKRELEPVQQTFLNHGWDIAIGSSGTILAAQDMIGMLLPQPTAAQGGVSREITPANLAMLEESLIRGKHIDELHIAGLSRQRASVFPGGLAILSAIIETLGVSRLQVSDGALREGLIYDMLGRFQHDDIRTNTVADLARRYHIDRAHAQRVCDTTLQLLIEVADVWHLPTGEYQQVLRWGAELHEIGLDIAHNQYHKHGGYLLQHMDMPGFSRSEQQRLAFLVRAHRRKFPIEMLTGHTDEQRNILMRLAIILRLAVVLRRNRSPDAPPLIHMQAQAHSLRLLFPPGFLHDHPLTALDLREEAAFLKQTGYALSFAEFNSL